MAIAAIAAALAACAPAPLREAGAPFRDCADCPEMIAIPPGRFVMGTPDDDPENWSPEREGPPHPVTIARAFALGRYEVTRSEYWRFVEDTGRRSAGCAVWNGSAWQGDVSKNWRDPGYPQSDRDPVVCVTWADAGAYTAWLAQRTGKPYRLPTEAEWEYAARAGTLTRRYWGDSPGDACRHANAGDRSLKQGLGWEPAADCDDGRIHTAPVGSYLPNAFGLHDMLGNVWEWTEDCWTEGRERGYRGAPDDGSARSREDCPMRVTRGAAWNSNPRNLRSSNRGNYSAGTPYDSVGFRVARALD